METDGLIYNFVTLMDKGLLCIISPLSQIWVLPAYAGLRKPSHSFRAQKQHMSTTCSILYKKLYEHYFECYLKKKKI